MNLSLYLSCELSITDVSGPEQHDDDEPHLLSEEALKEESCEGKSW